jgi:hypothetical protein
MAQCCSDPDALWIDDYESGAPFTADYRDVTTAGWPGIPGGLDCDLLAGHGLNGSIGVHSAHAGSPGFYAEFAKVFDTDEDICGNKRREFAVGGQWNFANDPPRSGGFWLIELRHEDIVIFSLYRVDSDLLLYDANADEVGRVFNIIPAALTFTKIEVRGGISTGFDSNDGWIEIRVNSRIYSKNEDAALVHPGDPPKKCFDGWNGLNFDPNGFGGDLNGWDTVVIGPQGDFDCLYIRDSASYCDLGQDLGMAGGACEPPGPGGSDFDGNAEGPRIVHRGGYQSTYSAPSGGGTPASASNPTDPQTLSAMTRPLVSVDITLCDGTVERLAMVKIPRTSGPMSDDGILHISPVTYPMSDRHGNIEAQAWDMDIADPDGVWRERLRAGANRFYRRWRAIGYIEDDAARLAGTARRSFVRSRCVSVDTSQDLIVKLSFVDELNHHDSPFSLDRDLPPYLIGDIFKATSTSPGIQFQADPPEPVQGEGLQIITGWASDVRGLLKNPPLEPVGIVKPTYIGNVLLQGELWHAYVICLYACRTSVNAQLFGSNMHPECPASVQLDPEVFSSLFLMAGMGNWSSYFSTNYNDITNASGEVYRTSMLFGRGEVSQQHVDGKVPLSLNVEGVEDVGDGSGNLIDDLAYQCQWLLDHPILRATKTGSWGSVATFPDGASKIDTDSFAAVKALHDQQVAGGKKGALIINTRAAGRQWLAELLVAGNMELGTDHHGRCTLSAFDDTQSTSGVPMFGRSDISADSFKITSEPNGEIENSVRMEFGPEPATGRMMGQKRLRTDAQSIIDQDGEFKADDLTFKAIYDEPVAEDTVARQLLRTKEGITRGEFTVDLAGGELAQGEVISVTDFRGLGTTGWTNRVLRSKERVLNPNVSNPPAPEDLTVTVHWEDVHAILLHGDTDVSAVAFHPPGTEAGGTAVRVGNEADGTAFRVGN